MNFSEVFKLSSQLCKFSPDGKYLVSGRGAWVEGGPSAGDAYLPREAGTSELGSGRPQGPGWRQLGRPRARGPCRCSSQGGRQLTWAQDLDRCLGHVQQTGERGRGPGQATGQVLWTWYPRRGTQADAAGK